MATAKRRPAGQRGGWGTKRVMRSGKIQASYVGPDGRRYYAP